MFFNKNRLKLNMESREVKVKKQRRKQSLTATFHIMKKFKKPR